MPVKTISAEAKARFITLMPLLEALFREFQDLSKKKPDGVLNQSKISVVNRVLADILTLLDGQPARAYLNLLEADDIPQYSDVVVMLGQAVAAMETFKAEHYGSSAYSYGWHLE